MSYRTRICISRRWSGQRKSMTSVNRVKAGVKTDVEVLFTVREVSCTHGPASAEIRRVAVASSRNVMQAFELRPSARARWSADGRRPVPPVTAGVYTQPGRERPHSGRPLAFRPASAGVAHVPAMSKSLQLNSARDGGVECTRDRARIRPQKRRDIVAALWAGSHVISLQGSERCR